MSEFVSEFEVRADEALRTTQAIGKSMTRELDRLARRTQRITDPEKLREVYRAELQAFMREELNMARQAVRMGRDGL
ncbi:protein of unknown function [Paraburkholderia kururiensis]|uniref:hypothetical protein n=1 Tax=Paraburkholderia kururiensis TaxID=984307 RepID=UPI0039A46FB2